MFALINAALVAASIVASPSPSPSPSPSASPTLKTIGTTVTTAERRKTPLSESVKPTFVITRTDIENNGYDTVGEALTNVPGVVIQQYGAFGAEADYSVMGALSGSTQVLLNGVPISAGSSGAIDLGTVPTAGVERIEVVESGSSTLYGSGASGGVINIITGVPKTTYVALGYGSFADRLAHIDTGNGVVGISYERHVVENDYPYAGLDGYPGGVRQNDEALQTNGSIEYQQQVGGLALRASGRFTQLFIGQPGELNDLTPNNSSATNRDDLSFSMSHATGAYLTSVTLSGMRQGGLFFGGYGISGPEISALIDARTGIQLKEVVSEHGKDALVAGVDLARESALDTLGPFGPPPEFAAAQSQTAIYAQQTIGIGHDGKAYAGIRGEIDKPGSGSIALPSAGLLLPVGAARVSFNAGSTFIVPTLFDLYFPGYSNPNLLSERDRTMDASVSLPNATVAPTLTLFDRVAQNLITQNAQFIPINAGTGHFQGTTFSVRARSLRNVTATLSVTDLWNATQSIGGVASRIDYEPLFTSTLDVERVGPTGAAFGVQYHVQGPHTESYAGPGDFGAYRTADAYVKFQLAKGAFLTGRVKNLANEQYGSYYAFPQPGRSYRVELTTR